MKTTIRTSFLPQNDQDAAIASHRDDLDAAVEQWEKLGAEVVQEPTESLDNAH